MLTSDNELLGQYILHKDQAAFEQLIRRHTAMVLGVCNSMLWHKEDAEDVYQSVFLLLSTRAPKLLNHNSVGGWLHEVAVRSSLKHRSAIARTREVSMLEDVPSNCPEPWKKIAESREKELLHREIVRLPKRYRNVIVLCHLEGKSRAQAASILDVTTASVKASLARGRKLLRRRLLKHGVSASVVLGTVTLAIESLESIIQTTLTHCKNPTSAMGNGMTTNPIQFFDHKVISNMGLTQTSIGITTILATIGAFSIAALGQSTVGDSTPAAIQVSVATNSESNELGQPSVKFQESTDAQEQDGSNQADTVNSDAEIVNEELVLISLRVRLEELRQQLGAGHPEIRKLEHELAQRIAATETSQTLLPAIMLPGVKFLPRTEKKSDESWDEYVQRLIKLKYMDQSQWASWQSGKDVELKHSINVKQYREESRTRMVSETTFVEKEIDGKKTRVPVTRQVPKASLVKVPYTETKTVEITIPGRGTQPDDEPFEGFSKMGEFEAVEVKPVTSKASLKNILKIKPIHPDAGFDPCDDINKLQMHALRANQKTAVGYQISDKATGIPLRQFVDKNGDLKIDQWIYYKGGKETYREIDANADGLIDQFQFTEGTNVRIGIDEDQDQIVDRWDVED